MTTELPGADDLAKFGELAKFTHKQQAVWFLNGMWEKGAGESEAENFWKWVEMYAQLDLKKKAEGCDLDELNAHVFLEKNHQALTVKELRDKLREIGWEKRPMMFPIVVFLIMRYKADWHYIVNAPQGNNQDLIDTAQRMLDEAQAAVDEAIRSAEAAKAAEEEATRTADAAQAAEEEATRTANAAKAAEEEATRTANAAKAAADEAAASAARAEAKAEEARVAEAPLKAAEEEVKAALAEVQSQESARDNKTADLTKRSEEGGAVTRNKAKAELAAHLSEDPLPLRKAKITLQAAERKAEKTRAPFKIAREAAEAAAAEAEAARQEAESAANAAEAARRAAEAAANAAEAAREEAARAAAEAEAARQEAAAAAAAAEQALQDAHQRVAEAEAYLEEQKKAGGPAMGAIWFMERELAEKKKYMPTSKGGVVRK